MTSAPSPLMLAAARFFRRARHPPSRLRAFLEEEAAPDQLVTVLGVRGDDPACNKVQTIAELAHSFLVQGLSSSSGEGGSEGGGGGEGGPINNNSRSSSSANPSSRASVSGAGKYKMVRVDFAEHRATAELYGVQALPAFLMFQGGRLAWAGTLGGNPLKAAPPAGAAGGRRVLLVEPCAKVKGEMQQNVESGMREGVRIGGGGGFQYMDRTYRKKGQARTIG